MNIRGVDFVMFPVSNLTQAVEFYRDVLGLPLELHSEEYQWAEFNCGNLTLALKGHAEPGELAAGARLALAVADVQATHRGLVEKGVPVRCPPQDNGCCWHLEVTDPDGHIIILHHRTDGTFGQQSGVPASTSVDS